MYEYIYFKIISYIIFNQVLSEEVKNKGEKLNCVSYSMQLAIILILEESWISYFKNILVDIKVDNVVFIRT